jgi:hypothetical protein
LIAKLRELFRRAVPITARGLIEAGEHRLLHAVHHFGGLRRARRLAGLPTPRTRRLKNRLDAENVLREIRRRHHEDEPLASTRIPVSLQSAAQRHFGSWRDAIEAAGLDYKQICLRQLGSDEELMDRLRSLAQAWPQMTWLELRREPLGPSLRSRFGSLEEAVERARIDAWPTGPRPAQPKRR